MSQPDTTNVQSERPSRLRRAHEAVMARHWFATYAVLTLAGYVALFVLLQSTILWQIYSPVQAQFPELFGWLLAIFPDPEQRSEMGIDWGLAGLVLYMLVLVFLFAVYLLALKHVGRLRLSALAARRLFRQLLATTAGLLALLMVTREIYAVDLFAYSWFGRIWAVFGDNPYIHVPSEYAATDAGGWLPYLYWHDLPAPYGPVWLMLAGGIAKIANLFGTDIAYHVVGHKLLVSAAYLVSLWLIWRVAGHVVRKWVRPPRPNKTVRLALRIKQRRMDLTASQARATQFAVTLAFAWNPLMLIEFGISGHNDLLMLTCVLLALYLHLRGRWQLAVLSLALAFLIKFTAIIFLPGYLWLLLWKARKERSSSSWSKALSKVGSAAAIFTLACVGLYIPFWQGPTTLNVLYDDPTSQYFVHSFGTIVNRLLPDFLATIGLATDGVDGRASLEAFSSALARWVPLFITALVAMRQTWTARDVPRMLRAWGWTIFVLLTIGLAWFWPWYVAWLLVPALLSLDRRLVNAAMLLSFTSLTIYLVGVPLRTLWPDMRLWTALWVMGLPLLYVGYTFVQQWSVARRQLQRPAPAAAEVVSSQAAEGSSRL